MYNSIIYDKKDGVAILTLNRPEKLNCMNDCLISECRAAIKVAEADQEVGAIMITGAGKAFCAGGDIAEMLEKKHDAVSGYEHMQNYHGFTNEIVNATKPVIGCVNGVAVGGGFSLVLLCDIVYASTQSKFRSAFQGIGLVPDLAFIYRMSKMVGTQKTFDIIYTDRVILPEEAAEMGFVSKVIDHDDLFNKSFELAKTLANGPRVMLRFAKKMINTAAETPMATMLEIEARAQTQCFLTEDHNIAAVAFVNKDKPKFIGR